MRLAQVCCFNPSYLSHPCSSAPAHPTFDVVSARITFTLPDSIHCTKPRGVLLVQPCSDFSSFISKRHTWSAKGLKPRAQRVEEAAPCMPSDPLCVSEPHAQNASGPEQKQMAENTAFQYSWMVPSFPLRCCDSST